MNITWDKILRGFYHITTAIVILGSILLFIDNEPDMIYSVWIVVAMVVGSYLIEKK